MKRVLENDFESLSLSEKRDLFGTYLMLLWLTTIVRCEENKHKAVGDNVGVLIFLDL